MDRFETLAKSERKELVDLWDRYMSAVDLADMLMGSDKDVEVLEEKFYGRLYELVGKDYPLRYFRRHFTSWDD